MFWLDVKHAFRTLRGSPSFTAVAALTLGLGIGATTAVFSVVDALLLRPGSEHVVENTGPGKLYTLTVMTPNEGFAELIRGGAPVELDAEDLRVLGAQPWTRR